MGVYKASNEQVGVNKSKHADLVKLSPFLLPKSRQLHQAGVLGVKQKSRLFS